MTLVQIYAILALLFAFGVDQPTLDRVELILLPPVATTTPIGSISTPAPISEPVSQPAPQEPPPPPPPAPAPAPVVVEAPAVVTKVTGPNATEFRVDRATAITVSVTKGNTPVPHETVTLELYRVAQEALIYSTVLQGAATVSIPLTLRPTNYRLETHTNSTANQYFISVIQ